MKILIEGEKYEIKDLELIFEDPKFYSQNGNKGVIKYVGYYHSFRRKEIVYLLPKVFIHENKVFGKYSISELLLLDIRTTFKHDFGYNWIRQLIVYFYNSLVLFKKRYSDNIITEKNQTFELNTNLNRNEYSYLDLLLSFVNYYKKNKDTILYHHIEYISNQSHKPKWEKTVRKSIPIIGISNSPIYVNIRNNKNVINKDEELLVYFFSILNYFNTENNLDLQFDKSFSFIKGSAFVKLQKNGLSKLRHIKYRYFSDSMKRMYQLCELYFSQTDMSSIKRKKEEFISVRNYNIIFEDMIDKLFSDKIDQSKSVNEITLDELKHNRDGKIIDHLYEYQSLIDTSNIFYIGDSKYYKPETEAGKTSKYKQFTYAKNIIQFNIDFFNENKEYLSPRIRYRDDELTEGYNISPNFFIYGYIRNFKDFENDCLEGYKEPKKSYHFEHRLFDRDTLFVHQYQMNFLFVLKSYSDLDINTIEKFRKRTQDTFRNNFINYFNSESKCLFRLFEKDFEENDLKEFVELNFKLLNGKCISIDKKKLIVAKHIDDDKIDYLLKDFIPKSLN